MGKKRKIKETRRRRKETPARSQPDIVLVPSSWVPDLINPAAGEPYNGPLIRGEIVKIEQ